MVNPLSLFDAEGNVVEELEDDDLDELESAMNPQEEASTEEEEVKEEETKSEEETVEAEAEAEEKAEAEAEAKTEETEETEEATEEESVDLAQENLRLHNLTRSQAKELAFLKSRMERLEKAVVTEPEEGEEPPPPSRIEELQAEINQIAQAKGPSLEVLIESMSQNPKYADVHEVCSQENLNFIIGAASDALAVQENRDAVEIGLELEAAIWSERNPYAVIYDLVKSYHPAYKKVEETETSEKKEEAQVADGKTEKVEEKTVKEPVAAAKSIADAGKGTKTSLAGWTAARIDEMDEFEIAKVPEDVYEKYMQGQLD